MLTKLCKAMFVIFFLSSIGFSSVLWVGDAQSTITTQPLIVNGKVIVGSEDGNVNAFSLDNGELLWNLDAGQRVKDIILFKGKIVALTQDGKLAEIKEDGGLLAITDLQKQRAASINSYGLAAGNDQIFITTDRGIFTIDARRNATLFYRVNGTLTKPSFYDPQLLVGVNDELITFNTIDKTVIWRKEIGEVWTSWPVFRQAKVVMGTLTNKIYSFEPASGRENWIVQTKGWVMTPAKFESSMVFLGSNDGKLYAINDNSGKIEWIGETTGAIQGMPASGIIDGKTVIFVGSQDRRVYAFDQQSGKLIWVWRAKDTITSLEYNEGKLIVPTRDGKVYAHNLNQGCMISLPLPDTKVGKKDVELKGYAFPSGASVQISVNAGAWNEIARGGEWEYDLNIDELNEGNNLIECRTSFGGIQQDEPFLISLIKDSSLPLGNLLINYPSDISTGESVVINVTDAETFEQIEKFTFVAEGKTNEVNGALQLEFGEPKTVDAVVSKKGYNDAHITINIRKPGDITPLILPLLGASILILAFLVYLIKRFVLKPKVKAV